MDKRLNEIHKEERGWQTPHAGVKCVKSTEWESQEDSPRPELWAAKMLLLVPHQAALKRRLALRRLKEPFHIQLEALISQQLL